MEIKPCLFRVYNLNTFANNKSRRCVVIAVNAELITVIYLEDKSIGRIGRAYFRYLCTSMNTWYKPAVEVPPAARILYG